MLTKVLITIHAGGYSLVAYETGPSRSAGGVNASTAHSSKSARPPKLTKSSKVPQSPNLTIINCQSWQLQSEPFSELSSGKRWDELGLSARYVEALDRVSVASSKLARKLGDRHYTPLSDGIVISILPGRVEARVSSNAALVAARVDIHCHYEWDDNRQLLPLKVTQGDAHLLPKSFLLDFKEACFGRYGLLARQLERAITVTPEMDDMGSMRWA